MLDDNYGKKIEFIGDNRGLYNKSDIEDPYKKPRLGRRESEPQSEDITYLYDVLMTNFPNSRALWDLHHYFLINGNEIDLQFDISFFIN